MAPDDDYVDLPPNIADALERAETKYRESIHPANPYAHLRLLDSERILGADFLAYENTDLTLPESLAQSPVLLHSANARFHPMCHFISCHWLSDFGAFARKLIHVEELFRAKQSPAESDEWELLQYGLQAASDAYVIGFSGPDTATFTNKELILRILILSARAFGRLPKRFGFDPLALRTQLEVFCAPR